jgi:hypothetical protein
MIFIKLPLTVHARASIHACRKANRHFVVREDDVDIYKSVLQSLIVKPVIEFMKKPCLESEDALGDSKKEEVLLILEIVQKN